MEPTTQVKKLTEDLLNKLEVAGEVSVVSDETSAFRIGINTEETGLVIGYHGKTLESLQLILGIIVSKSLGYWAKVYLNVGDYREKREEALMHMAQQAADRVLASGRPVELARLSAAERRIIHLTLSGDERILTESIGEGRERILIIRPKP